jgi:hypothetical protein
LSLTSSSSEELAGKVQSLKAALGGAK